MKESKLESFQSIYRRACERKGGERVLEAMLQAGELLSKSGPTLKPYFSGSTLIKCC